MADNTTNDTNTTSTTDATGTNTDSFLARLGKAISFWVETTFPGHKKAFIGGVLGLIVGLLILWLGIWRALVVAIFIVIGVAIGQYLEGDAKILKGLRDWLSNRH